MAEACDEAWLIAERDRQAVARACPRATLHVVTNGVDQERFYPLSTESDPYALLFVGNMSVLHNIDAVHYMVDEILPLVQKSLPSLLSQNVCPATS